MELIYKSSNFDEFKLFGLIDQWEQQSNFVGKSAYQVATENDVPLPVFWDFYYSYKAMKRA